MALIQCHECSKEVSDEALACPHCGAPKADAQPSKKKPKREPISLEDWEGRGLSWVVFYPGTVWLVKKHLRGFLK